MRLFFSVPLPEAVEDELDGFCEGIPRARWSLDNGYHLTLAFLGETSRREMDEAIDVARSIRRPPFELRLAGAGVFPLRGEPKVLWIGVEPNEALKHLQKTLDTELRHAGFDLERRKFHPHVTLARIAKSPRGAVESWLAEHIAYRSAPFLVGRFELQSSILSPHGSEYDVEESFRLRSF